MPPEKRGSLLVGGRSGQNRRSRFSQDKLPGTRLPAPRPLSDSKAWYAHRELEVLLVDDDRDLDFAIPALTAQHTRGVTAVHLPSIDFLRAQINARFDDFRIGAVRLDDQGAG